MSPKKAGSSVANRELSTEVIEELTRHQMAMDRRYFWLELLGLAVAAGLAGAIFVLAWSIKDDHVVVSGLLGLGPISRVWSGSSSSTGVVNDRERPFEFP